MQMKWKKTGAALLVATLTVTGSGYAWANENLFDTVDLNKVIKTSEQTTETATKTTEDSKSDVVNAEVTTGDTVGIDIEIPEGYTAGNLEALSKAYDNAGNETAKAAIKRNAERAIEKFEASQKVEPEAPESEEPKVEQPVVEAPKTEAPKVEQPKVEEPTKEEPTKEVPAKKVEKEERKALQAEQKAERKALQEKQKEERKALQAEHKAEKQENKKNKKDEDKNED